MRRLCIALTWLALALTAVAQDSSDLAHTVAAGETLISIANAYGVSLEQLLTLNDLDPEAILPIGRQLIVIEGGAADEAAEQAEEGADTVAAAVEISTTSVAGLPPAPVVAAAAPMLDPLEAGPSLCIAVYADDNQNGLREPNEDYLEGATVMLLDETDAEALRYHSAGAPEPHCLDDLSRQIYRVAAVAPDGYGWTGPAALRIDLHAGGAVQLGFGAKRGLATPVGPAMAPALYADGPAETSRPAILLELSGLFVLALAGVVVCSGLVVSVLLRGR